MRPYKEKLIDISSKQRGFYSYKKLINNARVLKKLSIQAILEVVENFFQKCAFENSYNDWSKYWHFCYFAQEKQTGKKWGK